MRARRRGARRARVPGVLDRDRAARRDEGQGRHASGSRAPVGDVEVVLGDWVVGDVDGVTVVPGATLEAVLTAARARAEKEDGFFAALRDGATTIELLGLDESPVDGT